MGGNGTVSQSEAPSAAMASLPREESQGLGRSNRVAEPRRLFFLHLIQRVLFSFNLVKMNQNEKIYVIYMYFICDLYRRF